MEKEKILEALLDPENLGEIRGNVKPFMELMMLYDNAIKEVRTKFEVLNAEFSVRYDRNPVEAIKSRLKSPGSIARKLKRDGFEVTVANIREHLSDVAGVRIICSFPEDIYTISGMFLGQDDITLIKMKDYIQSPKESGYRSMHLIVEVPIFLTDHTEQVRVEVQLRTIAMDFWASLEHRLRYKNDLPDVDGLAKQLRECADGAAALDQKMQEIHRQIDGM